MSESRAHYRRRVSDPAGSAVAHVRLGSREPLPRRPPVLTDRPLCHRALWSGGGYFGQAPQCSSSSNLRYGGAFRTQMRLLTR